MATPDDLATARELDTFEWCDLYQRYAEWMLYLTRSEYETQYQPGALHVFGKVTRGNACYYLAVPVRFAPPVDEDTQIVPVDAYRAD